MDYHKIKDVILKKPFWFVGFFLAYILLNIVINQTHLTFPTIFVSFPVWFAIIFILINIIIVPTFVSLTINLSIEKFKDLKSVSNSQGVFSIIGIFGTLLGGACPGCFVGLFPAFIGLFGTAFTLGNLPLYGLEIQILSLIILGISLHYLTRPTICLIK